MAGVGSGTATGSAGAGAGATGSGIGAGAGAGSGVAAGLASVNTSATTLTTSSSVTCDLTKYRSAPSFSPRSWSSFWLKAVIMITLVCLVSVVDRRISSMSKPLIFGIITSEMIRSGLSLTAKANASSPSLALTIS